MPPQKPKRSRPKADLTKVALQLRISLLDVEPEIWRRFVVPANLRLDQLHGVMQVVMGWFNCHLHLFRFPAGDFGIPDPEFPGQEKDEREVHLHELVQVGDEFDYSYDFGDGWKHRVRVEATVERGTQDVPRCIEGARRCPPEDVGGPWGYSDFLEAYLTPRHERRQELVEWIGEKFDSERFDLDAINTNLKRLVKGLQPLLPDDDARWR